MKNLIYTMVLTLSFIAVIETVSVDAQIDGPVSFTTAFDFTVGNATFPAGTYTVRPVEDDQGVLEIIAKEGKHSAIFEVQTAGPRPKGSKSEVVFKKYGDKSVLSEIWEPADDTGVLIIKSRAEDRHAKKSPAPPTTQSVPSTKPSS